MKYRKIKSTAVTRVEYSFGRHTILTRAEGSQPKEEVVVEYYDTKLGVPVRTEMTRDDLGDLMVLLDKMKVNGEIHIPTDYVTD